MIETSRVRAAALLLCLAGLFDAASAGPASLNAKVVWVREERAYIASPDSLALEQGAFLTFRSRGKTLATGEVTRVHGEVAVVKLSSGSLQGVKNLARLEILGEPPPLRVPRVLRIGYPARGRSNLLFSCDPSGMGAPPQAGYRREALTERSHLFVRDAGAARHDLWPDTLVVRFFDEAADQEIATERGELDVAVFWPGELSAHLRQHPRWQDPLLATRARGVIAGAWLETASSRASRRGPFPGRAALASLNQRLFRGDLAPLGLADGWHAPSDSSIRSRSSEVTRFEVDPSLAGQRVLERFLDAAERGGREASSLVRLFYLDGRADAPDSLALAVADYVRREALSPLDVAYLFAIRCPVVCEQGLRSYVSALGAGTLVDLLECRPGRRQP